MTDVVYLTLASLRVSLKLSLGLQLPLS